METRMTRMARMPRKSSSANSRFLASSSGRWVVRFEPTPRGLALHLASVCGDDGPSSQDPKAHGVEKFLDAFWTQMSRIPASHISAPLHSSRYYLVAAKRITNHRWGISSVVEYLIPVQKVVGSTPASLIVLFFAQRHDVTRDILLFKRTFQIHQTSHWAHCRAAGMWRTSNVKFTFTTEKEVA
jgi:hypothetical protein